MVHAAMSTGPWPGTMLPFPSATRNVGGFITRRNAGRLARPLIALAGMLEDVANTAVPTSDGRIIQAFVANPKAPPTLQHNRSPLLILIHEFWGLAPELCRKAEALADELGCIVIAPDTFRGQSTRFIPKAIFLALSTPQVRKASIQLGNHVYQLIYLQDLQLLFFLKKPDNMTFTHSSAQERVNADLDEVLSWASTLPEADIENVGLMGFCYGGGKAIRYAAHYKKAKAIAVIYGKPLLDVEALKSIRGSVLGIFGDKDTQFPLKEVKGFEEALLKAGVKGKISTHKGQGHAFWRDMDQVRKGDGPQRQAWIETTSFLRSAFDSQT